MIDESQSPFKNISLPRPDQILVSQADQITGSPIVESKADRYQSAGKNLTDPSELLIKDEKDESGGAAV